MLKACAPGHEVEIGLHHLIVRWGDRTYPSLPKGAHGKRPGRAEIKAGDVKQLVELLQIDRKCAQRELPILKRWWKTESPEE